MEKLSLSLQEKIANRPTQTIIREESGKLYQEFMKMATYKSNRDVKVPDSFDGREVWGELLNEPMDQGTCGSCWAFASTGVLADRFNIHSLGLNKVKLSPTKLILCNWQGKELELENPEEDQILASMLNKNAFENAACTGNTLLDACRYLYQIGTATEECIPYNKRLGVQKQYQELSSFENETQLPLCHAVAGPLGDMCSDFHLDVYTGVEGGTPQKFFKALTFYSILGLEKDGGSEYNIKENIFKWGPVATGMAIYPDFYTFDAKNDIYSWDGIGPKVGGHAIEIVGWGKKNGKKYWDVKNSWGTEWGDGGYFKIERGINECKIEENCVGLIPDFFYPVYHRVEGLEFLQDYNQFEKERLKISTYVTSSGGGIDLTTGLSRRVMSVMPWVDFEPPVVYFDLPDWKTFIAGRDATKTKRLRYQKKIKDSISDVESPLYKYKWLIFTCILILVVCIIYLAPRNQK